MRQLYIHVPRGCGRRVLELARKHEGTSLATIEAEGDSALIDLVIVQTSNSNVEGLLDALGELPDLQLTLAPQGVIVLKPPAEEAPEQATDVEPRSPVEVFLGGLQSVGSWTGFVGYAAAAGIVVWIALFTETTYLLTAAMLIAPFAGPAMNAALATARGDVHLLGRSIGRYFAGLLVTILVAVVLSLVVGQQIATRLMVEQSFLSSVAILLPLTAGAAGALNLCQSDRSSLVSGAATGMLVAASLAPPAGLVGMGIAIGEWGMAGSAVFVLFLQIVGINLSGALVFRFYGVSPKGARYSRGDGKIGVAAWLAAVVIAASLLAYQFSSSPDLLRSSQAQRATADTRRIVEEISLARLVVAEVRFVGADIPGQNTMLVMVYVQSDAPDSEALKAKLQSAVSQQLSQRYNAVPLVDVTVLRPDS